MNSLQHVIFEGVVPNLFAQYPFSHQLTWSLKALKMTI